MIKKITLLLFVAVAQITVTYAQCGGPTNIAGNLTISANQTMSGVYNITGTFTINSGVTVTLVQGCTLTINAADIVINGTISGDGTGGIGGSGGSGGGSSGGAGGGSLATGGGGGSAGSGAGGGAAGNNGGTASGGCGIDCGNSVCANGNDADRAGGGGGSAGSGGAYGGVGGSGGNGATGRIENEPGNSRCGSTPVGGSGGAASGASAAYGNLGNNTDLVIGSGGAGAGGGGGGYNGGTAGSSGGKGGGAVNLNATGTLQMNGTISVNGTNGNTGGNGGIRSGNLADWNCEACGNGNGGGSNDCRDATLCGVCTYYTWGWPGGAGGGAGGGSGGGIKLQALGNMSVTGTLLANGGNGGNAGRPWQSIDGVCNNYASGGGAGSGGVIKLVYNPCATNTFSPAAMQAAAGTPGTGNNGSTSGNTAATGAVYNQSYNIYPPGYTALSGGSVTSADQTLCFGTSPSAVNASVTAGGINTFSYQWYYTTTACGSPTLGTGSAPNSGWSAVPAVTGQNLTVADINTVATATGTYCFQRRVQSGGCYAWTTNISTITINPGATVTAGGPDLVCQSNTPFALSGASVGGGASTGAWSITSGSGTLSSLAQTANPALVTFTPTASGTVVLTLTTNDPNGPCVAVSATRTVTVQSLSVAPTSITGTSTICVGGNTTLTVSGGSLGTGAQWYWYSGSCGGTFVGNGTSITVSPGTTTTYFVRAQGTCNTTGCASLGVTVNTNSTAAGSVSATVNPVCSGSPTSLSVNGGSLGTSAAWFWYTGPNGTGTFVGNGTPISVSPLTTTTYYVRAEGICNNTTDASVTISTLDLSVAPTSISGPAYICINGSTNLSVVGGSLGASASWKWYSGSCGGTPEGSGSVITVNPTVTTTYFVRGEGSCNTTTCASFTLTVNPLPNGSLNGSVTVCYGVDTSLTFNFAVGTAPYSVVYTDGANVFTKNNLNTGDTIRVLPAATATYTIQQITDANGCVRTTGFLGAATVTVAPLPVVNNVFVSDVLCNGGNTGAINITAANGTPGYVYSDDNGANYQSSNLFAGLTAGTYQVFIKDALACTSTPAYPVVVGEPTVLTHTALPQNASCDNVFDGKITVTASGGVSPYTYSLNGGPTQPGNVFNGLSNGTYTVLVTDNNACTSTSSVFIDTAYAVYGSLVSQTPVSCFGGVDGTVTVQLTGGVPPYSYSINGVQFVPTSTFTGLASGNYVVTLRDSKGCTDFVNVTVTQPNQLQAQIDSVFNIGCNGSSSGAIYITVSGGNPAYSFLWSNGATTEDITGLVAGTYNVAVTDTKGCSASVGATISQPLPLFVNVASYHDLLCFNDSSGSIDITANGGVPPYSFVWSNGATTEDIYGLLPNTYSATVTDANGCQQTISQDIIQPSQLSSTISSTQVLCAGAASGSVDLTVTGGTTPYNFVWNNGATTEDLSGVSGGTYTVVVHDANGCSIVNSTIVTEPTPVTISFVKTDVLCNGDATGAVDLTVTGGAVPYDYSWSSGASVQDLTGVIAGIYTVTVKDANNCSSTTTVEITQPAAIILNSTVVNVGCAGGANGSVDITVQGGVFPYTYLWSNGATTEDVHNISGGNFSVTVTDANACSITAAFSVTEPGAITSSIVGTDVTCNGAHNGAADLTVSGGTLPYTFLWSTFQGSEDISGLDGGLYYVIITDANGCDKKDSVLLAEPPPLILSTVVTNVSCFNANDGAIDLTVTGGSPNYSYAWSNFANTEDLNSLPGGLYVVIVTDNHNCTATTSATIVNPSAINTNFVVKNPLCNGDTSGRIDLIASGGTPAYTFLWSNGAVVEDLNNIGAGTYIVTITDSRGCSHTDSAVVTEPGQIFTSGVVKNVTCAGLADGFVDITAYAGTLPYGYLWSTGQSTEDIFNITGGDYYVTVTDANGCQAVSLYIIKEPLPLGISLVKTDVQCYGAATGTLTVIPTGGSHPYYYLWSNFATDSTLAGVVAGHYVIQLTDSNGCFIYDSTDILQPTEITITGSVTNAVCYGAATGSINITVTGGTGTYTYGWTGGAVTEDLSNIIAGTYTVTVTDANGCVKTATFTVGQGVQIISNLGTYDPICHGGNTGSITSITTGGVQPYQYLWSNTKTTISIGNLIAGTYTVTITDALSCTASASAILNDPAAVTVISNASGAKCFNTATGQVISSTSGGFGPYTYQLNGVAQSTDTFNHLLPGDYFVVVTDVNGCQGSTHFTIASPAQINVSLNVTDQVILTGMHTQMLATTTSTSAVLNYFWNPDLDTANNPIFDYSPCGDPQNCANPYAAPRTTTTFTVTVMNADSCYASDTVTVQVLNQPSAFIPTAFTPNSDGLNDRFEVDILGAINIDIAIFDRWGQRVYYNASQANGISNQNGWDGKINGKPAPFDTYIYQMKVTYFDHVTKDFTGTVTLMK